MLNSEIKNRILLTLGLLIIYRFGTFIPVFGMSEEFLKKFFNSRGVGMLGMINLFSGGALERMSIFALNIMPYITSSIIIQLLTSVSPRLESLKKDGGHGRAKINQYTRYLTIFLSIFQALSLYYAISSADKSSLALNSGISALVICSSLVGGTAILMWFGEKITAFGIGNGISMIVFIGIVSSLPTTLVQVFTLLKAGVYSHLAVTLFFLVFITFLVLVVFVEKTFRRIKIQYSTTFLAKVSNKLDDSFLPLKVNISGVIPPIFASSVLMFPIAIIQIIGSDNADFFFSFLRKGGTVYLLLFSCLIMFFSYFYSSLIVNSEEISNNLKKSNCFIVGVRPGKSTSEYLDKIVSSLAFLGALYLIFVCVIPEILTTRFSIPFYIGGTGILIMVNVLLELINQIQSYSLSEKYRSGNFKSKRVKIRL